MDKIYMGQRRRGGGGAGEGVGVGRRRGGDITKTLGGHRQGGVA